MTNFSLENSDFIYAYLSCLLPKKILLPILSTIKHHVKHHGVEFTTKWLKSCKVQYLHYLNGSNVHLISTHSDMTPKGSLRPLWSMKSSTVLQVLSISSVTILKKTTPAQEKKFLSSVMSDPYQGTYVIPVPCDLLKIESLPDKDPLSWLSSPNKAAPYFRGNVVKTQPETEQSRHECFSVMTRLPYILKIFKKHRETCSSVLGFPNLTDYENFINSDESWMAMSGTELFSNYMKNMVVGKIGIIQEKGAKLRAVANPFRLFQMLLTPLGDFAFACLKTRSWDCTHDQNLGIDFGIQSLQEKKTVHSIDLSDATNLFPLSIQVKLITDVIEMLNTRTPPTVSTKVSRKKQTNSIEEKKLIDLLDIFVSISRGDWIYKNKPISWTRGQPLGLYPSFPMFAFAHGCIIESIETFLDLRNTFRILGDDVIINHPEVARLYKERMENLGCIISPEKTIVSSTIFEFAGKVANAKGVIPFHKFQPYTFKNPLGPLVLGIKGKKFIDSKVRNKVVNFASIPEPVGLGLNPNYLSLETRMSNSYQFFFPRKRSTVPYYSSQKLRDYEYVNQFWKQIHVLKNDVLFVTENYKGYYPVSLQDSNDFDKAFISRSNWINHVNSVNSDEDIALVLRVDGQVVPDRGKPIKDKNLTEVSTNHLWKRILNFLFK